MKDNWAFWDTSAIVPLCVHENSSARARQTLRRYPRPVVWWGTLAEARSAFARALRVREITIKEKEHAIRYLERLIFGKKLRLAKHCVNCPYNYWTIIRYALATRCN